MFNLTIIKNIQYSLQYESVIGCADEGGASSAHDALRSSAHPMAVTFTVNKSVESWPLAQTIASTALQKNACLTDG